MEDIKWIVSIVIAIIGIVVGGCAYYIKKTKNNKQVIKNHSSGIQAGGNININSKVNEKQEGNKK